MDDWESEFSPEEDEPLGEEEEGEPVEDDDDTDYVE